MVMENETCGSCSQGWGYGVEGVELVSGEVEEGVRQREREYAERQKRYSQHSRDQVAMEEVGEEVQNV